MCAQGPATPGPDYANFTKNMSIAKLTYDDFIDVYKYCQENIPSWCGSGSAPAPASASGCPSVIPAYSSMTPSEMEQIYKC